MQELDHAEALLALQARSTPQQQAFVLADTNHDNCLQLAEVAAVMARRFAALDLDRDQLLTKDELPDDLASHLARLDTDGDGKLTFIEVMAGKEADFKAADGKGLSSLFAELQRVSSPLRRPAACLRLYERLLQGCSAVTPTILSRSS